MVVNTSISRDDACTHLAWAVAVDRDSRGHLRVTISAGADGQVTQVTAISYGLAVPCVDCVLRRAAANRFSPPEGGKATIVVPVTFVKTEPAD